MQKETVMVICAHSDDQIFGPGATIAKYAKEGKQIITIILSYGETSNPHLKEEVIIKMRVEEAQKADKVIGGHGVFFFNLKEGKFKDEAKKKHTIKSLGEFIKKYDPSKIFTHSIDDPLPDHKATYDIVIELAKKSKYTGHILSFDVWNPFNLRKRTNPKLYVDVSKTFSIKLKALKCFESQKPALASLTWTVYLRAFIHGLFHRCKYAERFYLVW